MSRDNSDEIFALHVLTKTFPEELSGLTQESHLQKPDLQDSVSGIGVEVTEAQYGDNSLMQGLAIASRVMDQIPDEKNLERLERCGLTPFVVDGVFRGFSEAFWVDDSYPAVSKAIEAKLAKLNAGNFALYR